MLLHLYQTHGAIAFVETYLGKSMAKVSLFVVRLMNTFI